MGGRRSSAIDVTTLLDIPENIAPLFIQTRVGGVNIVLVFGAPPCIKTVQTFTPRYDLSRHDGRCHMQVHKIHIAPRKRCKLLGDLPRLRCRQALPREHREIQIAVDPFGNRSPRPETVNGYNVGKDRAQMRNNIRHQPLSWVSRLAHDWCRLYLSSNRTMSSSPR